MINLKTAKALGLDVPVQPLYGVEAITACFLRQYTAVYHYSIFPFAELDRDAALFCLGRINEVSGRSS